MFPRSIRWRLQLWLAFLLVCVLSGFGVTVYQLQRVNQLNQIDEDLERRVAALSGTVRGGPGPEPGSSGQPGGRGPGGPGGPDFDGGPPPRRGRPEGPPPGDGPRRPPPSERGDQRAESREVRLSPETASLFDQTRSNAFYFAVWHRDGTLRKRAPSAPAEVPLPTRLARDTRTHTRTRGALREAFHFTELGDCVLAGLPMTVHLDAMQRFQFGLLAAGGSVLALGLGIGWWLTTRAIRPVEEISAAASRISAGNLSERISVAEPANELGRLAAVLNTTFARLEAAFAQQRQFTADASHELRTPLAVLISEAQTTLARARSAAEYRETVEACLDTAQQMRRLTESLLELARSDAGHDQSERTNLDLAAHTRACVERIRPLAQEHGLTIYCELASFEVSAQADRLAQVITNLLSNAIHYNKPGGEIRVSTRLENLRAVLTVGDTGQGIAPEDLPHIFERFYRVDKARSRAGGHAGLGLAIGKAIIEADGGTIRVQSVVGTGTQFVVTLPPAVS